MNKKEIISLNIFSFLVGCLIMFLLLQNINTRNNNNSLNKSIKKIEDAVFYIESYYNNTKENSGTAFVYRKDNKYGYLLTNEHVISKGNKVKVINSKDKETEATILGKDAYLDLAILRIDKKYITKVAILGNSNTEEVGNTIFTVGSPLGYNYRGSVSSGIISGKNRIVTTSLTEDSNIDTKMKVLQVDASINPGNSGGPLLNINGEVIGICTLKLVKEDVEGMGFAIPIEYVKENINILENSKEKKYPELGINIANAYDTSILLKNNISINNSVEKGVVITNPKKNNNFKKGDIIIKVNNIEIYDKTDLRYELYKHNKGERIKITLIRNNKKITKTIKLT